MGCGDDKPVMWGLDHDIRIPMKQPGFKESKVPRVFVAQVALAGWIFVWKR